MHRVLERLDVSILGSQRGPEVTHAAIAAGLAREGLPPEHPRHDLLARRLQRFVGGSWLAARVTRGATLHRELPFAVEVPIEGDRRVLLRGAMDLVVVTADDVAVVDYKRARGPGLAPYAFQLRLYVYAARKLFPDVARVRAGVVFLGGEAETPSWLPDEDDATIFAMVARATTTLHEARARGTFPRVERPRCEAIHCGYVGRCHPRALEADLAPT